MRVSAFALLLLLSAVAHADSGVLIAHVPSKADNAVVLAVVKQAFISRGWSVETVGDTSVTASISRKPYTARMRIALADRSLLFDGEAKRDLIGNPAQAPYADGFSSIPRRWIANLRKDIAAVLSGMPD